jgi:hypothetical protein
MMSHGYAIEAHLTADNVKYNTANLARLLRSTCALESTLSGRTGAHPAQFAACTLLAYPFDAATGDSVVILLD